MQKSVFRFCYQGAEIEYDIWFTSPGKPIERIMLLGTVQVGKVAEWVAHESPAATAVVQGTPHWYAQNDGSDVPDFVRRFSEDALANIRTSYPVQRLKIVADSQAAPPVLNMASDVSRAAGIDSIVLVQPLGLNIRLTMPSP